MKKIILMGRSEAGKTTLTQALRGKKIEYQKTQYINRHEVVIDTPGEYIQTKQLGYALALYSYEADVVGLLIAADEPFSLYPPCLQGMVNRELIGIVTKADKEGANVSRAKHWLELTGCRNIFITDSKTGRGVKELLDFLYRKTDNCEN